MLISSTQCDQIGRFIALWATFLSLSQQLFCPNYHVFRQFVKGVKIFHFYSEISFGSLFFRHLVTFYWSRCIQVILIFQCYFQVNQVIICSKNENKSWYLKKAENKLIFDSCHLNSHRPSQTQRRLDKLTQISVMRPSMNDTVGFFLVTKMV